MEPIQYNTNGQVHQRPLLIAPQINKFCLISPSGRATIEFVLGGCRCPARSCSSRSATSAISPEWLPLRRGGGGRDADITGAEDVNSSGAPAPAASPPQPWSGASPRAGAARSTRATIAVCVLDMAMAQDTTAGMFVTPQSVVAAKAAVAARRRAERKARASRMFAWMRPNDLVWNYWVNNYLMGNAPPAFDILYWNCDSTRLAAKLHADFLDLIDSNPVRARHAQCRPRRVRRRRPLPITLRRGAPATAPRASTASVRPSSFRTAAISRASSTRRETRRHYWSGEAREPTADAWLEKARKNQGSW